ncbi:hypothetical protein [Microvirus D_HF5_137]|nr:hypothetical protein [Microvirus D_HF5_137]
MLEFKPGVSVDGIKKEIITIICFLGYVFESMGKPLVITSCTDGKHMKGSKHYSGNAIDIRSRHLTKKEIDSLISRFKFWFDKDYDIVLEKDHIHVEYDPH